MDSEPSDDWRSRGVCRDEDPEQWFPVGNSGPALLQTEQAKAACRPCPVKDECLAWALEFLEYGVAGGMSEDERRAVKRRGGLRILRAAQ
ncbi:WhiB family transcriptional regulator [Micromonospora sp. NPDC050695]|uniref:WhiB family transcriptional regulator n=1 Tax=Micromonospora sp. NPDC050695 TaxID=3154938 RepID=UPI0033DCA94C